MNLQEIYRPISTEMSLVNECLKEELCTANNSIRIMNDYISSYRGKYLRPAMFFLSYYIAQNSNSKISSSTNSNIIKIAAAIELIHTATLLHDDVVDEGKLRRNKPTANAVYGNESAVLFGDYLYAKAFSILSSIGNQKILQILSKTACKMSAGEITQTVTWHYPENGRLTEYEYLKIIEQKTAQFFSSCCQCGVIAGNSNGSISKTLADYGRRFGIAYQIMDDCMDLIGDEKKAGKTLRSDATKGKPTLPMIYLLEEISTDKKIDCGTYPTLLDIWEQHEKIQDIALGKTISKFQFYIQRAKQELRDVSNSVYSEVLMSLCEYVNNEFKNSIPDFC